MSRSTTLKRVPSAMGLTARLAYARARERGIVLRPLLANAGLTAQELADTRTRVPVSSQIRFLNLVAEALDDDMLGLSLASDFELRRAGMLYYVLASSETLVEVFERGARFTSIVNEGMVQELVRGRGVGFSIHYAGVKRQDDRHQIEFWVASLMRICRQITGRQIKPDSVRLAHYPARGHARLSKFVGCAVEFGASQDEVLFSRETAQLRVPNADPFLNHLLVEVCEDVLSRQRRSPGSFAARVENSIAPRLPHGKARATHIAAELGMSERTFARRLEQEGQTYSQVLDRLRLELAMRYLVKEQMPISRVAWLLGYREPGAFTHAFRRWTGKSPSEVARGGV